MRERIEKYLDEHRDDIHRDILRLLAVSSVSEDRAGCRRALAEFLALAESMGFTAAAAASGDVGTAVMGPDLPGQFETMGILAHVDVVDPGEPGDWSHSHLGELAEGAIWGRGALDDKGPLVICLWAVKALRDLGVLFRKRVSFIVGTMEEVDWLDIDAYLAEAAPPDFGFTPDGEFPVINREKGHCDVFMTFDRVRHRALGEYEIVDFKAGTVANSIPDAAQVRLRYTGTDRGHDSVGALKTLLAAAAEGARAAISIEPSDGGMAIVKAKGKSVHSSMPELGDNALVRLCVFLAGLGRNGFVDFTADCFADGPVTHELALQTRDEYARGEFVGPTTASPDLVETTAGEFILTVNLRMSFDQTEEELRSAFEAIRDRYGYSFRLHQFLPALFISKERPFMRAFLAAYEAVTGRQSDFILAPGTSYAKAMPKVAAFGPVFPGQIDLCHMVDEKMSFEDVLACARIYAGAVYAVVSSPDSMS